MHHVSTRRVFFCCCCYFSYSHPEHETGVKETHKMFVDSLSYMKEKSDEKRERIYKSRNE